MMMDYYADVLKDPTLKEMVTDIHESSTRLIGIVNDFLDVSRIEQGKIRFDFAEVELHKVIEQVAYEMKTPLILKKVSLNFEPKILGDLPRAAGDANRIKQVIYNLVGNAVKFTEAGGTITVMAEKFAAKSGDMLKVTVTDTGRGIPLDTQKFLFHKFQQAGSSIITRDTARGTGLGLYISKLLVDGMGGELLLEKSQPDKGSTFAFTLPIATAERIKQLQLAVTSKGLADTATGLTQTQSDSPRA
jgi:two-component system sensor histidine kinase BarA